MSIERDRRKQRIWSPEQVLSRSHDPSTAALVVRSVGSRVRYTKESRNVNEADAERWFERVLSADDDSPNTTQPHPGGSAPRSFSAENEDAVTFFSTHDPSTQSLNLEVWCKTDLKAGHAAGGAPVWVCVARLPNLSSSYEYTVQTGQREVFFRVTNSAGLGVDSPTLYATSA